MNAIEIIEKKRDAEVLSKDAIEFFLNKYLAHDITDYQMSAFLMAVYFNGLNDEELYHFTHTMTHSGRQIVLPKTKRFIIDKHSTGGVGDKTSIALAPLLASLGLGVAKLTGRGLGHTGGTIDKFESVPGFAFPETPDKTEALLKEVGIALLGYSDSIVPLDKLLYTLRDVTATVPSIPLIASSIMSKKLAMSADAIILDVKVGNGTFMENQQRAEELAETMLRIGKKAGRNVACVLSSMEQPLGHAVGNANEFIEAVETLKGRGPKDFTELVCSLASTALCLAKKTATFDEGKEIAAEYLQKKKALGYLRKFLEFSGGDVQVLENYSLLPQAEITGSVRAAQDGYIQSIDTKKIGRSAMLLGAGRMTKDQKIDYAAGLDFRIEIGQKVKKNQLLVQTYTNSKENTDLVHKIIQSAILIDSLCMTKKNRIILNTLLE